MKIEYAALAVLAGLAMNCGGDHPPPQDPSTIPAVIGDADAAAPQSPAPAQPTK